VSTPSPVALEVLAGQGITLAQASRLLSRCRVWARRLAEAGKLETVRIAGRRVTSAPAVERYRQAYPADAERYRRWRESLAAPRVNLEARADG
jgi:hypothetical protein